MTQRELFDSIETSLGRGVDMANVSLASALTQSTNGQVAFNYNLTGWTAEGQIDPPIPAGPAANEIWYKTTDGEPYDINTANKALAAGVSMPQSSVTLALSNEKHGEWYVLTYAEPVTQLGVDLSFGKLHPSITTSHFPDTSIQSTVLEVKLPSGVTALNPMSFVSNQITSLTIGPEVSTIFSAPIAPAFVNNSHLEVLVVDGANTTYDSRGDCNGVIESGTDTLVFGCNTTALPESVTKIGDYAFVLNSFTAALVFPASITDIGTKSFTSDDQLASLTFKSIKPPTIAHSTALSGVVCDIFVPAASVEAYKGAQYWSAHASQIKDIEE